MPASLSSFSAIVSASRSKPRLCASCASVEPILPSAPGRAGEHHLDQRPEADRAHQPRLGMQFEAMADLVREHAGDLVGLGRPLDDAARQHHLPARHGERIDEAPVEHAHLGARIGRLSAATAGPAHRAPRGPRRPRMCVAPASSTARCGRAARAPAPASGAPPIWSATSRSRRRAPTQREGNGAGDRAGLQAGEARRLEGRLRCAGARARLRMPGSATNSDMRGADVDVITTTSLDRGRTGSPVPRSPYAHTALG